MIKKLLAVQSIKLPVRQTVSWSVGHIAGVWVGESVRPWVSQSVTRLVSQLDNEINCQPSSLICQLARQSVGQSIRWPLSQLMS